MAVSLLTLVIGLSVGFTPAFAGVDPVDAQSILLLEAQRQPAATFGQFVESTDSDTRARAAVALGRIRDPLALESLAKLASDPEVGVRIEAAFALGQTPNAERTLIERLHEESDPTVIPVLLEALGKQARASGLRLLTDALREDVGALHRPLNAEAAALALGRVAMRDRELVHREEVLVALIDQLRRLDRNTRRAAAFALARIRPEEVESTTASALLAATAKESDPVAQAYLVRATASLTGVGRERARLYEQTRKDPDAGVRIATARAASTAGWGNVAKMLDDPNPRVRQVAIESVGQLSALARLDVLLPIVTAGDTIEAAEDLATTGDPRLLDATAALESLTRAGLLEDVLPWLDPKRPTTIRTAAVAGLTDQSALRTLALEDAEGPVRIAAVSQLTTLEPRLDDLLPLLTATDAMVTAVACESLGSKPVTKMEKPILATLQTANHPDVLAYCLGALAAAYSGEKPVIVKPHADAIQMAEGLLQHAHSRVRAHSLAILEAAKKAPATPPHFLVNVPLDTLSAVTSARIQTDKGEFIVDLIPEIAPVTVWNFVQLAESGWFDGVTFHRIVPDFVVQTGDPRGDGTGGPEWTVPDEINRMRYQEGVVGMAHSGPDTAGSQWFVTLSPQPHLDGSYTAFAKVIQGMHVVRSLTPEDRIRKVTIEYRAASSH